MHALKPFWRNNSWIIYAVNGSMIGVDPINDTRYVCKSIGEYHALAIADKDGTQFIFLFYILCIKNEN